MNFRRQVGNALDEEHRSSLELLGAIEAAFLRAPRSGAGRDAALAKAAGSFAEHLEQDVNRHFAFEEEHLLPRLAEIGEGDIAQLLLQEHEAIRALADELLPLARAAAGSTLGDQGWSALKAGVLEMVERQVAHIQKETMGLLPMLEDLLDDETDRNLSLAYAAC